MGDRRCSLMREHVSLEGKIGRAVEWVTYSNAFLTILDGRHHEVLGPWVILFTPRSHKMGSAFFAGEASWSLLSLLSLLSLHPVTRSSSAPLVRRAFTNQYSHSFFRLSLE